MVLPKLVRMSGQTGARLSVSADPRCVRSSDQGYVYAPAEVNVRGHRAV